MLQRRHHSAPGTLCISAAAVISSIASCHILRAARGSAPLSIIIIISLLSAITGSRRQRRTAPFLLNCYGSCLLLCLVPRPSLLTALDLLAENLRCNALPNAYYSAYYTVHFISERRNPFVASGLGANHHIVTGLAMNNRS